MTVHSVAPEDCCGCSACFNICPVRAITMQEDRKVSNIRAERSCINCGKCESLLICMQKRQGGRCIRRLCRVEPAG
ncbi:MAG: 4Fe-4S binding protein [Alphaproteobacteria bacterium]